MVEHDLTIHFALGGNSLAFLGGGWARAEPGFTWATGAESHLMLPSPQPGGDHVLVIDVIPFVHAPDVPAQRLDVSVNDTLIGSAALARPARLAYRIPSDIAGGERMLITLRHPDATRPVDVDGTQDHRPLAFAVIEARLCRLNHRRDDKPDDWQHLPSGLMLAGDHLPFGTGDSTVRIVGRTGLSITELAFQFESIGENCEFGLFQRRCEAEPLGLLRFSSIFMRNLIRGIDTGFEGLGDVEDIDPRPEGTGPDREFMIHETKFGLVYHSFVYESQRSAWLLREQEAARLKFLRRKFSEELEAGDKIFVYKLSSSVSQEEILALHMALNRRAKVTLLWVVCAALNRPCGTVELLMPGLLKGYIDRFAPADNAHDLSFDSWLQVCANAYLLQRLQAASAATADPSAGTRHA